jgi:hypothetical protein
MRTKYLRTPQLATLGLLFLSSFTFAQTTPVDAAPSGIPAPATPVKPTVETATTPVEQIKLNGRTLPLNIKTLAELQRLTEEKELREKLQETLQTGGAINIPAANLQPATPATPVATAAVEQAAPVAAPIRARPVVPVNTLMAVYGPDNNLKAEVFVGKKEARQLKKGDSFGNFRVASISQNGIQLEALNGSRSSRFIPVGQRLAN